MYEQIDPAAFRTPSSIYMRLNNFSRLDPEGTAGVVAGGRVDEEIWRQFGDDPEALALEVQQIRQRARQRSYWTWVANPNVFKVDDAIRERESDRWLTKGKPVKPGDRGAVWRSLGPDGKRGVIAVGEVVSEPYMERVDDDPYWIAPPDDAQEVVDVQYVPMEGLPIWSGTPALDTLGLNADRARGGTLFSLDADDWLRLLDIARSQRTGAQNAESVTDTGRDVYVIRAGKGGARVREFEDLGLVAVGFGPAGNLMGLDKAGIKRAVEEGFEGDPAGASGRS
ncbi:MAG: EVE domain-containing protein, partial [Acidimicrobiia bacterium]